jgi:hypothetical protein
MFVIFGKNNRSLESSVSIATSEVRFPAWKRDSSFYHSIQTVSGVHTASCIMVTVARSKRVKRPERESDHTPRSGAQLKNDGAVSPLPVTL